MRFQLLLLSICALSSACLRLMEKDPGEDNVDTTPYPPGWTPIHEGALNEPCRYGISCDDELICDRDRDLCVEPECRSDTDCATKRCSGGVCVVECEFDFDCDLWSSCINQRCVDTTACEPGKPAPQCGAHACDRTTRHCATSCNENEDCAPAYACDYGVCKPACTRRDDPLCDGFLCDVSNGTCQRYCFSQDGCLGAYRCEDDACVRDEQATPCQVSNPKVCGNFACDASLGLCASHCATDNDCAQGRGCAPARCEGSFCSEIANECRPTCDSDRRATCGEYRCDLKAHVCENECYDDQDCGSGYACNTYTRRCVTDGSSKPCTSDPDCGSYVCGGNGKCFTHCRADADCRDGTKCSSLGYCALPCDQAFDPACKGYECHAGEGLCYTKCLDTPSCDEGYGCIDEQCVPAASCSAGASAACGAYACDLGAGKCYTRCTTDSQCSSGNVGACGFGSCL
ncbi:MAG: hypothetical protein QM778_16245 [Myxococcales bacterium]